MMTYTGRGGLAGALIIFQAMGFGLVAGLQGSDTPLGDHTLAWIVVSLLNAGICYLVGRRVNRGLRPRFFDHFRENGRDYAEGHTFLHVRLEYAGVITIPVLLVMGYFIAQSW